MIAVIFEVTPTSAGKDSYFVLAAELAPILNSIDGFISVERFESMVNPGSYLSLSFWRDEAAVLAWRQQFQHQAAQQQGRSGLFAHYRLRVATVVRDYGLSDRRQAPEFISL
ncbi:antibiotic biosynthesis monooxygenase [Rheinheimera sp.]|uniref:antibiotic biosynthesis monooxygenase family protein n=1 Tax=Rheinheimera sp. TaxID=1869214 RepID=UPI0027365D90|nr:antibiotic biosynthesis monooxygenase [Rheinheimera sp.]MDP2715775.1 antibiotic biosynthesis monooxygenase [Rheinheimera sp.]